MNRQPTNKSTDRQVFRHTSNSKKAINRSSAHARGGIRL